MIKYLPIKYRQGFTIVEWLVYVFVFFLISGGAMGLLFSLNTLFIQHQVRQVVLESSTAILERTLLEVREADSVLLAQSTLASTTAGMLTLTNNATTTKIQKNGNNLELYKNGVFESLLHTSEVRVIRSSFYQYESNGVELVRVVLEVESSIGGFSESWTISGSAILRGTYEN